MADNSAWVESCKIGGALSTEELVDELSVDLVLNIEFSSLEVLKLVVLKHLGGDSLSSKQPDTLDLKELAAGLLSDNSVRKSVGS